MEMAEYHSTAPVPTAWIEWEQFDIREEKAIDPVIDFNLNIFSQTNSSVKHLLSKSGVVDKKMNFVEFYTRGEF